MRAARAHWRSKTAIDLPAPTGLVGVAVNEFWVEMYYRERHRQIELLNYVPAVMYLMSGIPESVEFEKRTELLRPFRERVYGTVTQTLYSGAHERAKARQHLEALKAKKAELDRINWIGSESFSVQQWFSGR